MIRIVCCQSLALRTSKLWSRPPWGHGAGHGAGSGIRRPGPRPGDSCVTSPPWVVALVTAVVLNRDIRGRGFWRAIYFYPVMLSPVVVAVMCTAEALMPNSSATTCATLV